MVSCGVVNNYNRFDFNFNIICTNYCETQISLKGIEKVLQIKVYSEETVNLTTSIDKDNIER
jgi:hypothetical protein